MDQDKEQAKRIDAAAHELAQQLQIIAMALAAIERRDGERHAKVLEPARRAVEKLDRGLEEMAALARRGER